MQRAGISTLILFLGGTALFVDMFLRWGPRSSAGYGGTFMGWDVPFATTGAFLGLALALVELVRLQAIWWTPTSSLLGFFLAAGSGLITLSALAHLRWGAVLLLKFGDFGYGAWIAVAVSVALLVGAWLRLTEQRATATA